MNTDTEWDNVFRNMQRDDVLMRLARVREHFDGSPAKLRACALTFLRRIDGAGREVFLRCDFHGEPAAKVGSDLGFSLRQVQRYRRTTRSAFVRFIISDRHRVVETPQHESIAIIGKAVDGRLRRSIEVFSRARTPRKTRKAVAWELGISVRTLYRDLHRAQAALENTERLENEERARLECDIELCLQRVAAAWDTTAYAIAKMNAAEALPRARALFKIHEDSRSRALLAHTLLWCQNTERQIGSAAKADDYLREAAQLAERRDLPKSLRDIILLTKARTALTWPGGYAQSSADLRVLDAQCSAHPLFLLTRADLALVNAPAAQARAAVDATVRNVLSGTNCAEELARFLLAMAPGYIALNQRAAALHVLRKARGLARADGRNALFSYVLEAELQFNAGDIHGAQSLIKKPLDVFRQRSNPCEVSHAASLSARIAHACGDTHHAAGAIEEALWQAEGRIQLPKYVRMLQFAADLMGGSARRRMASAYEESLFL